MTVSQLCSALITHNSQKKVERFEFILRIRNLLIWTEFANFFWQYISTGKIYYAAIYIERE